MTIDLSTLWDFSQPAISEERFRAALASANADDALILQTQIARTYGMRRDFAQAQKLLAEMAPKIQQASPEAQIYYYLELGRSYASATHPPESQTDEAKEKARSAYLHASELAQNTQYTNLAIDALHMMAFVDTAPEKQVEWNQKALALMQTSTQPEAKKWAGALHNNVGYALHQLGRYEEALQAFKLALAAHENSANAQNIRIAYWMIAWTLRALERTEEAIEIQLRLERECDEAGEPDPYVFEELELLYKSRNDHEKAAFYAARLAASQ